MCPFKIINNLSIIISEVNILKTTNPIIKTQKYRRIASLPPIILGMGITLAQIIQGGPCDVVPSFRVYIAQGFGLFVTLFILTIGIIGAVRRLPVWSYSWIGISLVGFLGLLNILSSQPNINIPYMIEIIIIIIFLAFGCTVLFLILTRGWQESGLFSMSLSAVLGMILLFIAANTSGPYYVNYLIIAAGLAISAIIFFYVSTVRIIFQILLIIISLVFNTVIIFFVDKMFLTIKTDNESDFLRLFLFTSLILIIPPIISLFIKPLFRFLKQKWSRTGEEYEKKKAHRP